MKPISIVLAVALCANTAMSTAFAADTMSELSYRGKLTEGGIAANGLYDLTFKLFDAPIGGSQIGTPINTHNARIENGAVTLDLDFGPQTFAGPSRWLEVEVRSGLRSGSYTALVPRQQITGVPSTTFAVGTGQTAVGDPPSGAILYFNLTTCPAGWTEVLAGRGRYIVGHQPGAIVGNSIGAALGVDENRPVGQHSHGINDPGHSHTYSAAVATSTGSGNSKAGYATQQTSRDTTGITIKDAGTVPGTNAPYVVLLMCQKN